MNTVNIIGNLTRDPELRHTPSGMAVLDLGIAVNSREKGGDGEWGERADFFDVTVWDKQAESCAQYLSKGKKVGVTGRLRYETWEYEGQKRSKVKIVATHVEFLTPKGEGGDSGSSQQSSAPASSSVDPWDTAADDDIPF